MKKFDLYFWLFISFAMIGWIYEELYYFIFKHEIVNSGTMFGPWLPIYGFAGIIIYALSKKLKDSPIKMFIVSFILSGVIEYFTSYYLEKVYNLKWWDYSDFAFNLNGRICLIGLIVFSFLALFVMYFVLPLIEKIYNKINSNIRKKIIIVLLILFVADFTYCTFYPNTGNAKSTNISLKDNNHVKK